MPSIVGGGGRLVCVRGAPDTLMRVSDDTGIPAVLMRGGTSKGLILRERDLPHAGPERDSLLMRFMGTPDALQRDGLGGSTSSTSKVMVLGDEGPDGVVPYRFAQVGVAEAVVDWRGNCGNLTFAVAQYAMRERGVGAVRLLNLNTGVRVDASTDGDSQLTTRYLDPCGSVTGKLLPLGEPLTELQCCGAGAAGVRASLVDATNPYLFLARDEVAGALRPVEELRHDREFLERIEQIRAEACVGMGVVQRVEDARLLAPVTPRVVLVSRGTDGADIDAVTVSMQQVHRGIPMTAAMCLAAAREIAGTVVHDLAGPAPDGVTQVSHPLGATRVVSTVDAMRPDLGVVSVGITGTARTLMSGVAYPRPPEA